MPAASPSARTIAISPIVVLSPALTTSRAYQNAGAGLKMGRCARLIDRFALGLVVVQRLDQLEPRAGLAEIAEPGLHVVEQRKRDRRKEQRDQEAQCLTADNDQRNSANRAVIC